MSKTLTKERERENSNNQPLLISKKEMIRANKPHVNPLMLHPLFSKFSHAPLLVRCPKNLTAPLIPYLNRIS